MNCVTVHSEVCFHRRLFADRVRPNWCITGPVGPLGRTNQSWCGAKLLTMSVSTHPVGCIHIINFVTYWGDGAALCTLVAAFARLWLATHPHRPTPLPPTHPPTHPPTLPPTHPPTHPLYTRSVILQGL